GDFLLAAGDSFELGLLTGGHGLDALAAGVLAGAGGLGLHLLLLGEEFLDFAPDGVGIGALIEHVGELGQRLIDIVLRLAGVVGGLLALGVGRAGLGDLVERVGGFLGRFRGLLEERTGIFDHALELLVVEVVAFEALADAL